MSGNTVNQGKKSNFSAIVLMFVFLIGFIGITIGVNILATKDEQYLEHSGELRVLSQELAKNAVEAAGGKPDAFTQLRQARDNLINVGDIWSLAMTQRVCHRQKTPRSRVFRKPGTVFVKMLTRLSALSRSYSRFTK